MQEVSAVVIKLGSNKLEFLWILPRKCRDSDRKSLGTCRALLEPVELQDWEPSWWYACSSVGGKRSAVTNSCISRGSCTGNAHTSFLAEHFEWARKKFFATFVTLAIQILYRYLIHKHFLKDDSCLLASSLFFFKQMEENFTPDRYSLNYIIILNRFQIILT